jgi:hypothetical protein
MLSAKHGDGLRDARQVLRSWIATHVKVVKASEQSSEAKRLAAVCMADAMMAGIDPDALYKAAGGDLVKYISEAIDRAAMAEVDKMLERVRPKDATRTQAPEETG